MEQNDKATPEQENGVFRKKTMERVFSPDQLNDYIRVYNPSVWVIIIAVTILLVSTLIWSAYGQLPTTLTRTGVAKDGVLTLYCTDATDIDVGEAVTAGAYTGAEETVSSEPYSYEEVRDMEKDDYTIHLLDAGDWNFLVTARMPGLPDGMWEATITTGKVHPITFIFN